jgi:branched-chain amino acid transport system substrate-binding protein
MKRKSSLGVRLSIVSFLLLACFIAMPQSAQAKPKTLRIGFIAGMSGFASDAGQIFEQGAQLAKEWINDKGGITINGEKYLIELVVEDHKCGAEGAVGAATKLVYDQKLKFIAGTIMPFIVASVGTVTEPAKVLRSVLYNCATPSEYGPDTPYTFVVENATVEGAISTLNYLVKAYPKVKTMTVLIPDDGAIPFLGPIVTELAKARGIKVKGDIIGWPLNAVDFTSIAHKAVGRKTDAICSVNGWPAMQGGILKAARQMGYTKPIFITNYSPCYDILAVAGKEASTDFWSNGVTIGAPGNPPLLDEFARKLEAKHKHKSFYFAGMGFDGIWVLVQAIEAAQSLDPEVVKTKWEKMGKMDTLFGPGKLGGLKTYGIKHTVSHPAPIQGLVNGEVKHLSWENVTIP